MPDELSRLSDLNIEDPILRAHYYQRIIEHIESPSSDLKVHEIKINEEYRPDLVASRAFGSKELAWLVGLCCDVEDPMDPLPVGEKIYMPQASWVRRSMRQFMDEMGL